MWLEASEVVASLMLFIFSADVAWVMCLVTCGARNHRGGDRHQQRDEQEVTTCASHCSRPADALVHHTFTPVCYISAWCWFIGEFLKRARQRIVVSLRVVQHLLAPLALHAQSRELIDDISENLRVLVLALGVLGHAVLVCAECVRDCTGGFEPRLRGTSYCSSTCGDGVCGGHGNGTFAADCGSVFVAADSSCYTSAGQMQLDLVTPGLYS